MIEFVHHIRVAMNMMINISVMAVLIVSMTATMALGQAKPSAVSSPHESAQEKSSLIVTTDYILGPEDVLEITVWRNVDLSKTVTVRPDGRISLPLIGDVSAVGKTTVQLADEISGKLKEYKENPQVTILVKEVNSYAIYVLGEVAHPGKFPLKSKTTLLQAVTVAGGFTPTAARNKIVVFRFAKDGAGQIKIKASYDDIVLREGSNQNIELKPGDQIVVPSETMVLVP
ncbi:MAG: polysaccharide biosynthesis/export family protein [Nitrospirota bacterium]|nr:polysaccharide biosynthesis/export family protein [Nitrospirota bacterium]